MQIKNTLLVVATSSLLVACGSSSSNGTVAPNNSTSNPTPSNPASSNNTTSFNNQYGSPDNTATRRYAATGDVWKAVKNSAQVADYNFAGSSYSLNVISLNGEKIQLIPTGVSHGEGFYQESKPDSRKLISGSKYKYTKFGVFELISNDSNGNVKTEMNTFVHGFATYRENIPNTGTAVYKGDAVGFVEGVGMAKWTKGKATINVDFGASHAQVTGVLSNWEDNKMNPITFTRADNLYILGTGQFLSSHSDVDLHGQFYGKNAQEIGGAVYTKQNGHRAMASFAAIKQ